MRSSKPFSLFIALTSAISMAALAAHIDFNDPRRALGREDDVRVDAELGQETLSPASPISVTYQIQNLSKSTIAIADKVSDVSFDRDSQTVTISVGAEIPPRTMPHLTMIEPGAKRVFIVGGLLHVAVPRTSISGVPVPRLVQVKVTVLKNLAPFAALLAQQAKSPAPQPFPNDMFNKWVDNSTSIFLNTLPVYWNQGRPTLGSAEDSAPSD